MWEVLTKADLSEDLQTYSGLGKEQADVAAQFIFDNVVNDGGEVLECESRDRWIEYLEIGLEMGRTDD